MHTTLRPRLIAVLVLLFSLAVHSVSATTTLSSVDRNTGDGAGYGDGGFPCKVRLEVEDTGSGVIVKGCFKMTDNGNTKVVLQSIRDNIATNTKADYDKWAENLYERSKSTLDANHCTTTTQDISAAIQMAGNEIIKPPNCRRTREPSCLQCFTIHTCRPPTVPTSPPAVSPATSTCPDGGNLQYHGSCLEVVCELCRQLGKTP